ncbi:hypothetical protein EVAR_10037_1 [Eumeta japonica]|uniref:Uncharacterized protein n=1 Tax=Eumeta variegata TaxID=151549 RepID=A0A4C1TR43_EUMVA|nr:hypothetical protein EVAR_10037_1 [Eumeta japonica]
MERFDVEVATPPLTAKKHATHEWTQFQVRIASALKGLAVCCSVRKTNYMTIDTDHRLYIVRRVQHIGGNLESFVCESRIALASIRHRRVAHEDCETFAASYNTRSGKLRALLSPLRRYYPGPRAVMALRKYN